MPYLSDSGTFSGKRESLHWTSLLLMLPVISNRLCRLFIQHWIHYRLVLSILSHLKSLPSAIVQPYSSFFLWITCR